MQIKQQLQLITQETSGERAYSYAAGLTQFNRTQLSGGYHDAAAFCVQSLAEAGVDCRILGIPLGKGEHCWSQRGFDGWDCKKAGLRLTYPLDLPLCDYDEMPTSLMQHSCAADLDDAEIVMLDRGSDESLYADLDLQGKLIFFPNMPYPSFEWAIQKRGALGVVTDYIPATFTRDRHILPDARSAFSLSWLGDEDETPYFGFVITPRQGDMLKKICEDTLASGNGGGKYPRCKALVDVDARPGVAEIVEAFIPGKTQEEIIITGHLCHPKPSANDNASGCAGALEAMRAIAALVREGKLEQPRRGIRMVLVPEVSGTFAYLSKREAELGNIKAAINLDMIGRRQEGRSGMLGIWAPPDATPSFIIDLMAYVRKLSNCEAPSFNIDAYVTPFNTQVMEYCGGSDHYVYCDPTVGVPSVTFMQWMDKNYHTSTDVITNLDPEMLHKSTSMAACWAYALSVLSIDDVSPVFAMMRERFLSLINDAALKLPVASIGFEETCAYYLDVFGSACNDMRNYFAQDAQLEKRIAAQKEALAALAEQTLRCSTVVCAAKSAPAAPDNRVPARSFIGPISFVGDTLGRKASAELSAIKSRYSGLYGYNSVDNFILFRVNGKRSVSEIARLVGLESRFYDPAYVKEYLDFLAKYGVIDF